MPASFDTTTLADGLYDFRVIAVDNSGNGRCSAINTSVRVDNTAPVTTDNAPSGPRNSDVTVTLSPSDGGSGVTSTVYTVDGGPQQSGTSVVIPAAANDGTHTIAYYSVDAAGNQESTHTAQVRIDTTAPAGGSGNGGNAVRGNYVLTDSPTDTIASVEFQYRTGSSGPWTSIGTDTDGSDGWHVTWDTTSVADDTYHLQMIETDDAGNPTVTPLADTDVDNTAPASASLNVTGCSSECNGNVMLHGTADASSSGIGAMDFQVKGAGASGYTTVATLTSGGFNYQWNSTTVPDGPADIRIAVTDKAGNGPTYSSVTTVTVDNNAPTVALTAPSAASGTVSLGATGSADIASVTYALSPSGAGTWTTLGTANAPAPFTFAWASGARPDGLYDLRVTATDGGGNTGTDVKTITIDNTAPTGALTQPAASATVGGPSVALAATSSDAGTGVASVTYQYRPAGSSGSFTDISGATWDATGVASGDYELRATITDNVGNVATTAIRARSPSTRLRRPSRSRASARCSAATSPSTPPSPAPRRRRCRCAPRATPGATVGSSSAAPFRIAFDSSTITDGVYDVRVVAVDAFGNQATDTRTGIGFDNTAPQLTASTPEDGGVLPNGTTISTLSLTASEPLQSVTNVKVDGHPVLAAPVITGADRHVRARRSGRRRPPHLHRQAHRPRRQGVELPHQRDDHGPRRLADAAADRLEERAPERPDDPHLRGRQRDGLRPGQRLRRAVRPRGRLPRAQHGPAGRLDRADVRHDDGGLDRRRHDGLELQRRVAAPVPAPARDHDDRPDRRPRDPRDLPERPVAPDPDDQLDRAACRPAGRLLP